MINTLNFIPVLLLIISGAYGEKGPMPAPGTGARSPEEIRSSPERKGGFAERIKELNLTEEQKTGMKKIRSDFEKEKIRIKSEIETMEIDMKDEVTSANPDEAKVVKMVGKIGELRTRMEIAKVKSLFKVRGVLTKEQQEKVISEIWGSGFFGRDWDPKGQRHEGGRDQPPPHRDQE
jgi:Spy/CpxP family protein refolding chaperone